MFELKDAFIVSLGVADVQVSTTKRYHFREPIKNTSSDEITRAKNVLINKIKTNYKMVRNLEVKLNHHHAYGESSVMVWFEAAESDKVYIDKVI